MTVFLNGEFVPEERAVVSVFDRSFRYGDGLFETVLISNRRLFRWPQHYDRLRRSADFLRIPLPLTGEALRDAILELTSRNRTAEGIARMTLSRGVGPRGYAPSGTEQPTVVITTQPHAPADDVPWKVIVSSMRVASGDLLARHKTASRLLNVLAATEAKERGADEALLVDTDGNVTEGASSNVFWVKEGRVFTTPLSSGVLPGVTRSVVFELCAGTSIPVIERSAPPETLLQSDAVFLSFTSRGVVPVSSINERAILQSPVTAMLAAACRDLVRQECFPKCVT